LNNYTFDKESFHFLLSFFDLINYGLSKTFTPNFLYSSSELLLKLRVRPKASYRLFLLLQCALGTAFAIFQCPLNSANLKKLQRKVVRFCAQDAGHCARKYKSELLFGDYGSCFQHGLEFEIQKALTGNIINVFFPLDLW